MGKSETEISTIIKNRLKTIRGKETQEAFAKRIVGDNSRGRWANWESLSPKNIGRLPTLEDFVLICENADVSADYLIGKEHINLNDTRLISNMLNLSENSITLLKENRSINKLLDYLLTSTKMQDLIEKIDKIWSHNCTTEACESVFTKPVIKKADAIFFKYKEESGVWDTTYEEYSEMLSDAFFNDEYFNTNTEDLQIYMQKLHPNFNSKNKLDQYQLKINELAALRFAFHLKKEQYEILKYQIAEDFRLVIDKYIESRTDDFLNRNRS